MTEALALLDGEAFGAAELVRARMERGHGELLMPDAE
jgi:hypothetical protein